MREVKSVKKTLVLIHANNTSEVQCEWIEQAGLLPCHSLMPKYKTTR